MAEDVFRALVDRSAPARRIAEAVRTVLGSMDRDATTEQQTQEIVLAICRATCRHGPFRLPSPDYVSIRMTRANAVRRDFDGRNYQELASAHGVSVRTVRRILDDPRSAARLK